MRLTGQLLLKSAKGQFDRLLLKVGRASVQSLLVANPSLGGQAPSPKDCVLGDS